MELIAELFGVITMIKCFEELPSGTKVVDIVKDDGKRVDGQVLEIKHWEGNTYLCSERFMWLAYQFTPSDYEIYTGDKGVGEYL